jgi:hypothetical protein
VRSGYLKKLQGRHVPMRSLPDWHHHENQLTEHTFERVSARKELLVKGIKMTPET